MLLREKDRQRLLNIFSRIDRPVEIWAYGSRVAGTAHPGSDLDLVIRSADGLALPFTLLNALKAQIRDSNIPILVELRDWARLPPNFHQQIEARHEVLFQNISTNAA